MAGLRHDGAIAMAGGTQVALLFKSGLLEMDRIVWLGRIADLRQISVEGDRLVIGAGATLSELSRSAEVRRLHPALAETASNIGNPRVRAVATVGGHIAHADPRQDLPPVLLALGASVQAASSDGTRTIPLREFFTGFMSTALEPGELVTAIEVPSPPTERRAGYLRFAPLGASDYAAAAVAISLTVRAEAVIEAAIALGAGAAWPRLVPSAAAAVLGKPSPEQIATAAREVESAADPSDDQRGPAAYKRAMCGLLTRRLITQLLDGTATQASNLSAWVSSER